MNELSLIFGKIGLDTSAVLEAAGTKWNFHPYSPGLVGGHCIPVDPYYLVHKAEVVGYHPQVILAGRAINDHMPKHVAQMMIKGLNEVGKVIKGSKVLIDFFTKNRVKTALRVGSSVFDQNSKVSYGDSLKSKRRSKMQVHVISTLAYRGFPKRM